MKSWGIKCIGKEIFTVQGEYSANMIREAILGEDAGDLKQPAAGTGKTADPYVRDVRTEVCIMY